MKEDIKVGKYKVKKDNLIKLLLFVKEKENNKDKDTVLHRATANDGTGDPLPPLMV
jgi:hypothetical protein